MVPGGIAKAGSGVLALSGTNTYSGGTSITQGVLARSSTVPWAADRSASQAGRCDLIRSFPACPPVPRSASSSAAAGPNVTGIVSGPRRCVVPMSNWNNFSGEGPVFAPAADQQRRRRQRRNGHLDSPRALLGQPMPSPAAIKPIRPAQLLNTYLGNSGGTETVTISAIPFSSYNIYVYFTTAGFDFHRAGGLSGRSYYHLTLGPITTLPCPPFKRPIRRLRLARAIPIRRRTTPSSAT